MREIRRSTAVSLTALLCLAVVPGCGGDDNGDGGTDPTTTGSLRVSVTADGSPFSGVSVALFEAGASSATSTRTTGADGSTTFANLTPGSWDLEVDVPEGMDLAAGQDGRVSATVTADQMAEASFSLEGTGIVEVTLTANRTFSPSQISINPGTTVRWVSESQEGHTVTPDGHAEWAAASLTQPGQTFTHTFGEAGDFDYYCEPHLASGMTGRVVVQ